MSFLIDTNVLLRSARPSHTMHADAVRAVGELLTRGELFSIIPQNVIEYWAVATRPVEANGLGLGVADTVDELDKLKGISRVFSDTPALFTELESLVSSHVVKGKEAQDARIVAAMFAHRIPNLLTFNTGDFEGYTEITAVSPQDV